MAATESLLWLVTISIGGYVVYVFNRLVAVRNACANARAGIDVNLVRRHQLIPNLVETVRGYAAHEQSTLTTVTRARAAAVEQLGTSASAAAEAQLGDHLAALHARVEAYPELKADSLFQQLMRNLTEAEEQISASRRAFNAQVMVMNNLVQQFPSLLVARLTGFVALASFSAEPADRAAPDVQLTSSGAR